MTFQQSLPLGRPRARRLAGAAALALAMGLSSYALADDSAAAGYAFEQGFPTPAATRQARDDADFARAVTAYRFWYPTVSTEGIFDGMRSSGIEDNVSVAIAVAKPDLNLFTANSDTPYGGAVIDVSSGPMVIEIPPGPYIGFVDDHNQRWVFDFGLPGADAGRGGKYLLLPPGYGGPIPEGYYVGRTPTLKNWFAIRAVPVNGDMNRALESLRALKIYPLTQADHPQPLKIVDNSAIPTDSSLLHQEDNLQFWKHLAAIIDAEPVDANLAPMYGLLGELGIEKGKPFQPDVRRAAILERAARAGRDQMLVTAFDSDRPDRVNWPDRKWEWVALVNDNANFLTPSGIDLDARDRWFAQAIAASPAMFRRAPGAGSLYWLSARDTMGRWLDGGKSYRLAVPQPVPGKLFWSVTVYDAATRSEIRTDQDKAALRSLFELKEASTSEPVDLYFGPVAPAGHEGRWIKTIPGRGWFAYFRIYGPEPTAFDKSWKPGDFEVEP